MNTTNSRGALVPCRVTEDELVEITTIATREGRTRADVIQGLIRRGLAAVSDVKHSAVPVTTSTAEAGGRVWEDRLPERRGVIFQEAPMTTIATGH